MGPQPPPHPGLREQALPTAPPPRDAPLRGMSSNCSEATSPLTKASQLVLWARQGPAPPPHLVSPCSSPPLLLRATWPLRPPPSSWHFPPFLAAVRCHEKKREQRAGPGPGPWEEHPLVFEAATGHKPSWNHGGRSGATGRHGTAPCLKGPRSPRPGSARPTRVGGGANTQPRGEAGLAVTPGRSTQHSPRPPTCPRHQDSVETMQSRLPSRRRPGRASELLPGLPLGHGPPGPAPGCCRSLGWRQAGTVTAGDSETTTQQRSAGPSVLRVTSPAPLPRQGLSWHRDPREGGAEGAGLRGRCVRAGQGGQGPGRAGGGGGGPAVKEGSSAARGDTTQPRWLGLRRWTTWAEPTAEGAQ